MRYTVELVYFTEGKKTYVEGKIIHVQALKSTERDDEGDYVAVCVVEKDAY